MAKADAKGRSRGERHVRLYRYLWPALLGRLDGNSFKALFFMLTFEEGDNNGHLYMSARTLAEGIGVDPKTALRCLHALDRQGFIRPEQLGYFQQKGGPATRWRFTFLAAHGKPPTNEWRDPPAEQKSWGENFRKTVGEIPTAPTVRRAAVGKIGTVEAKIVEAPVGNIGTHTVASVEPDPVQLIRTQFLEWWRLATAKERVRLAKHHGVSIGELQDFLDGSDLPFPKLAAIRSTIQPSKQAA